jgi:hypothetical protein
MGKAEIESWKTEEAEDVSRWAEEGCTTGAVSENRGELLGPGFRHS